MCQLLGYKEYTTSIFAAGDEDPFGAGTGKVLKCSLSFPDGCEDVLTEVSDSEPRNDVGVVCTPYGKYFNIILNIGRCNHVLKERPTTCFQPTPIIIFLENAIHALL